MSTKVLTVELPANSLTELSNIVKGIEESFNDLFESLKEIQYTLEDSFKTNQLKEFLGVLSDLIGVVSGIVSLVVAVIAGTISAPVAAIIAVVFFKTDN